MNAMAMVRVSDETHRSIKTLAASQGIAIQTVIDQAIDDYRKRQFLNKLNEDFARCRADETEWEAELEERATWEATLADDGQAN